MKKVLILILVLMLAGAVVVLFVNMNRPEAVTYDEIAVERGDLVEKALAVGRIEPDHEIVVKSQVSGTVAEVGREVGEEVEAGEALMVVKPEPTPIELADARRQLELAQLNMSYIQTDLERSKALFDEGYISGKDYEAAAKALQEAEVRENQARERLELMEKGSSQIGDLLVESVIRAPTSGTILERLVNEGDPVVPLTSYQPGTELLRIANMDDLIFNGTVDEIDVGKIRPGMRARIHIGALPEDTLDGDLYFISPKSRLKDNVVVFDIKINVANPGGVTLRAGYSATADIIIAERNNVLNIPERLLEFDGDSVFVSIKDAASDSLVRHPVEIGFSDGLAVEVVSGLAEGDSIIDN